MLALHLPLYSAVDTNDEKWEDFNPKKKGIENEENEIYKNQSKLF